MSDNKSHQFRPPLYRDELRSASRNNERAGSRARSAQPLSEQKGWEAYRKWLTSVSGKPTTERTPFDKSIYSWKGYHNWADRVRQTWKSDDNKS